MQCALCIVEPCILRVNRNTAGIRGWQGSKVRGRKTGDAEIFRFVELAGDIGGIII